MQNTKTIECGPTELVRGVSNLISLPEIYLRIRELVDDPSADLEDFSNVVITDPNLSSSVLRVVNSAFFGFGGQIDTISRALNFFGIGQLHDLVLSISAVNSFSDISNEFIDMTEFWRRSVFCGVLTRILGSECNIRGSERLFVIGLLHEVGQLILFSELPDQSKKALVQSEGEAQLLCEAQREIIGFDYAQVGAELMQLWNLPNNFQEITACHTEPNSADQCVIESCLLHIAHAYGIALALEEESENYLQRIDPFTWKSTGLDAEKINALLPEAQTQAQEVFELISKKSTA